MFFTTVVFPLGRILLVKDAEALLLARYVRPGEDLDLAMDPFFKAGTPLTEDIRPFADERQRFGRYFRGIKEDFSSLRIRYLWGTPYQQRVWEAARGIPYGRVSSYRDIAGMLGSKGYRSVGQALNRNHLIIVIPCHRVVNADGRLGGFGAGLDLKEYLLSLEGSADRS